jgi:exportin-2 (importin alpha re-exporter)
MYLTIVLPETPKLTRNLDRKVAIISLTKTLTKSKAFAETYPKGWAFSCNHLLDLLINPPKIDGKEAMAHEHDVEDMSFGVGYTELVSIRRPAIDYFPGIQVGKEWVGQEFTAANNQTNGQIGRYIQERLEPSSQSALMNYMQ